jgi:phosphonate transport system substrate-binding protein
LIVLVGLALSECNNRTHSSYMPAYSRFPAAVDTVPQYALGVPAIRRARSLWDRYAPLIKALNGSGTAFILRMESGQTVDAYDAKLRSGVLNFAIVDAYQVLMAEERGYTVIARTGKLDRIRGLIVTSLDSGIHEVRELQGRTIAFTNPTALAATLLNQYQLFENGLDAGKQATALYTHSPESSLLNVAVNRAEAAAVSESDWEEFRRDHPDRARGLVVLQTTDDLSGPAVMASSSIPLEDVQSLQMALVRLGSTEAGRAALMRAGISGFQLGSSASYDDVWEFLERYRRTLGPLPDRPVSR